MAGMVLQDTIIFFFKAVLLIDLEHRRYVTLAGQGAPEICLYLPNARILSVGHYTSLSKTWLLKIKLRSSDFCCNHFST